MHMNLKMNLNINSRQRMLDQIGISATIRRVSWNHWDPIKSPLKSLQHGMVSRDLKGALQWAPII